MLELIKRTTEEHLKMPKGSIDAKTRKKAIKDCRQVSHWVTMQFIEHKKLELREKGIYIFKYEKWNYTLAQIGAFLGAVDHATVLHSVRVINTWVEVSDPLAKDAKDILKKVIKYDQSLAHRTEKDKYLSQINRFRKENKRLKRRITA